MRHTLLSPLLATAVSCSSGSTSTTPESGDSAPTVAAHTEELVANVVEGAIERVDDEGLLGIDLSAPTSGSNAEYGDLAGAVVDTEDSHNHEGEFIGPVAWPDRLDPESSALDLAVWLGTVLLNTGPGRRFDRSAVEGVVAEPLVDEFEAAVVPLDDDRGLAYRAVLVDSWVIDGTATSTYVEAVAVFERTTGIGEIQLPGFEFIYLDVTLVLDHSTWIAVEIQVSN